MGTMLDAVFANPLKRDKAVLLELGAGTGKFTKSFLQFIAREDVQKRWPLLQNTCYMASEPSEGFRDVLAQALSESWVERGGRESMEVTVCSALGTAIPCQNGSLDGVLVAQAFHWMATEETLTELHRSIRQGGALACIWNSYDYSHDWLREIDRQILTPAYGTLNTPRQQTGHWKECFATAAGRRIFGELQFHQRPFIHTGTRATVEARIMSTSVVAELPQEDKQKMQHTLAHILDTQPDLQEARETGRWAVPYHTEVAWSYRL
mmetsp:Transcript_18082/g.40097  ORF Transcript_18082/g.40097 Transcript_18082/m.40097 type:complete len:265 (+) Transcript_18082:269-1063(+)